MTRIYGLAVGGAGVVDNAPISTPINTGYTLGSDTKSDVNTVLIGNVNNI